MPDSQVLFYMVSLIYGSAVLLHLVRKNTYLVWIFILQSAATAAILMTIGVGEGSGGLIMTSILTLVVKAVLAPYFFLRLISKQKIVFSVTTYLNLPLTLCVILAITVLSGSKALIPLATLSPRGAPFVQVAAAGMLCSIFLMINRRGALSQIIGVLSLESCIVAIGSFIRIHESFGLQIGITFDLVVWIIIATVFVTRIHREFGTLDVTAMKKLKE